ncbi:MAG: type II secretion system protein [Patescibacteria group bacterium]|jgi:prepilin-type N-terminal cleavage/methylation domain-containing protein
MNGNKSNQNYRRKKSGFTLMEIVVVLALFSLLGVVIINVFLLALNSQRQASARQKTLASLRYATETIARQVRTSEINYAYYAGSIVALPATKLALIDQAGQRVVYSLDSNQRLKLEFLDQQNNLIETSYLTDPREVKVIRLAFYINPVTDPFIDQRCNNALTQSSCPGSMLCTVNDSSVGSTGFCQCSQPEDCATLNCDLIAKDSAIKVCLPFNYQPAVTMFLGFQSVGTKPLDQKTIYLQTTVSSRIYKR